MFNNDFLFFVCSTELSIANLETIIDFAFAVGLTTLELGLLPPPLPLPSAAILGLSDNGDDSAELLIGDNEGTCVDLMIFNVFGGRL